MTVAERLIGRLRRVRTMVRAQIDSLMSKEPRREVVRIPAPHDGQFNRLSRLRKHPKYFDLVLEDDGVEGGLRFERCFVCEVNIEPNPHFSYDDSGRLTIVYTYEQTREPQV